jgi:tRNA U34 5-carboxymethylaminomethyl modifying GTPase MnmE/TrmE
MDCAWSVQRAGRIDVEDVLEVVFGEFCVGK